MVVVFDMNLGYVLRSVEYITYSYDLMLFIIFGYVVLETMCYCFDIVLCGMIYVIIWYTMLYIV